MNHGLVVMDTIWFNLRYHKKGHVNCFQRKSAVIYRILVKEGSVGMVLILLFFFLYSLINVFGSVF